MVPASALPEAWLLKLEMHRRDVKTIATSQPLRPCLCLFDVDRTLTGQQELLAPQCPSAFRDGIGS